MANIALYPGGYKPPHIGHYKAAKIASQKANVIVFVGISPRDKTAGSNCSLHAWQYIIYFFLKYRIIILYF